MRNQYKEDWQPFASLHGFVRLVLLIDWDPIGILGEPRAMDEYDSYAADVCALVEGGATREQIAAHLKSILNLRRGMRDQAAVNLAVADKLILLHKFMMQNKRLRQE